MKKVFLILISTLLVACSGCGQATKEVQVIYIDAATGEQVDTPQIKEQTAAERLAEKYAGTTNVNKTLEQTLTTPPTLTIEQKRIIAEEKAKLAKKGVELFHDVETDGTINFRIESVIDCSGFEAWEALKGSPDTYQALIHSDAGLALVEWATLSINGLLDKVGTVKVVNVGNVEHDPFCYVEYDGKVMSDGSYHLTVWTPDGIEQLYITP